MSSLPLVLVVDDESHILHVVRLKLSNAGYRVITAEDGEEAWEMASAQLPDLLITDYQMPHMDGLELCRRLKAQASTAHIPAVMLTARGASLSKDEMADTRISVVLSKPFSPREILLRVRELLGQPQTTGGEISA